MSKSLRCLLGFHKWQKKWDHEMAAHIKQCSLCDKRIGTGWPTHIGGSVDGGA